LSRGGDTAPTSKAHDTGFFPDGAYLETVAPPAATVLEIFCTQPRKVRFV